MKKINLNSLRKLPRKDSAFRKFDDNPSLAFIISDMITEERIKQGVTQEELADRMGTKQPAIARAENSTYLPSLSFLDKMAKAFGKELVPPKFK